MALRGILKPDTEDEPSYWIKKITSGLMDDSGYPYPKDSTEPPMRAFAYGLAIGSLLAVEKRMEEEANERRADDHKRRTGKGQQTKP